MLHFGAVSRTLVAGLLLPALSLLAQMGGGAISGTITDPTGGAVAGADVAVENVDTHDTRKLTSSASGLYNAPNLTPGKYRITVSAPGFSSLVRDNLEVSVSGEVVANLQLKIGATTEQIEVTGEAPALDVASSTVGAVANGETVRELPLNGRDWTSLAALQPGVSVVRTQGAPALSIVRSNRGLGTQMTVGGNRPQQNNYRLDGVSVNDYSGGGPASVLGVSIGVDAIQEFSVITSNPTADYGKSSGGIVNAVTRAGTNQVHGSAYEFLRNSALDSRNFFDPGSPPPFKRNQFGGSAGGPLHKDKTFIFVDYEGLRQSLGVTNVDTVPSPAARTGALTTGQVTVDPKVAPYLKFYPLPNAGVKGDIGNYVFATQNNTSENFFTTRADHRFSDKDTIHGTFLTDSGTLSGPDAFNDTLLGTVASRKTANMEESHVFSSSVINFARIGFNRAVSEAVKSLSAINPAVSDPSLGFIPGRPVGQINIAGITSFQGGLGAVGEYHFHYNSYQAYDDLFIVRGSHSIKVGGSVERIQSNGLGGGSPNGMAVFGSLSAFLTNQPSTFSANLPGTDNPLGMRQSLGGAYMHDDWRIRPNLTLNIGLRYEVASVPTEQYNRLATLTSLSSPTVHIGSPYFNNPTKLDFSPRIGFAWDPFHDGKTAVRGGFGLYDSLPLTYEFNLISVLTAPYLAQGSSASLKKGAFPDQLYSAISGGALRTAYIEQDPKRNYALQWNFNIQRQVLPNLVLEAGYAGSHGVHSPFVSTDVNIVQPVATPQGYVWPTPRGSGTRINPTVGAISPVLWQVSSTYDGLRLRMTRRMSHGLQVQVAYTWAKSLDTGSDSYQTAFTNSVSSLPLFDSHIRKSLSDFDVRQNFVLNGIWEVPGLKQGPSPLTWAASGWQLGGIMQLSGGLPFTPVIAGDALGTNSSNPFDFPDRLNLPGCANPVNPGDPANYIKTQCFAAPNPGTRLGNAGRNPAIGPGLANVDFSIFKNNRIRRISETFNVQFRAELFNVMNHSNFAPPVSTSLQVFTQALTPVSTAGQLSATSTTSRQIQFALKVIF